MFTNPHWLFQLPYLSGVNIDPDELHVIHLGTSMYFLGSVLWLLCYEILPADPSTNMTSLWKMIVALYKQMNVDCQYSHLALGSFCNPKKHDKAYPKLKGKGAEVKGLMEPLCSIWPKYMRSGNKTDKHVQECLISMCRIQAIQHDHAEEPMLSCVTWSILSCVNWRILSLLCSSSTKIF